MESVLIFAFSLIIRLVVVFGLLHPTDYLRWLPEQNFLRAEAVLNGEPFIFPDAWSSYYLFLTLIYKLFDWLRFPRFTIQGAVILNIILSSLGLVLFYEIAKTVISKKRALIITLFSLLYYPLIYFNALALSENIFFFFLLLGLFFLTTSWSNLSFIITGLSFGIAAANRPAFLFFLPFLFVWLLIFKKRVFQLFLIFIPMFIVLCIFAVINTFVGRYQQFSLFNHNGGVNFAIAQCDLKRIEYNHDGEKFWFAPPAYFQQNKPAKKTTIPFYHQAYYLRIGLDCLKKNPKQLLTNFVHIKNVFQSVFYPDFIDENWHKLLLSVWRVIVIILFPFFFIYPFIVKKRPPVYWLFFSLLMSLFVGVYVANIGEERYLVPYFFTLMLFGIISLLTTIKKIIGR